MERLEPMGDAGRGERRVFVRASPSTAWLFLVGGVLCVAGAAVGFCVAIVSKTGTVNLQLMTTMPVLVGLMFFGKWGASRSGVDSVAIDERGIEIARGNGVQKLAWEDIAWNSEGRAPVTNVMRCTLYGSDGRVLARIPESVAGFEELVSLINRRIKTKQHAAGEGVRASKLRRQAFLLIGFGVLGGAACAFLGWSEVEERRREGLLSSSGTVGTAIVERKFTAPNGVTRRVEYRVDAKRADGGVPDLVNVELEPELWDITVDGGRLPVMFVPGEPDISRVLMGQIDDWSPRDKHKRILVPIAGGLVSAFFLAFGVLNLFGLDIVVDSETKKIRVSRGVSR